MTEPAKPPHPAPGYNVVSIQVLPSYRGEVVVKFGPNGVEQIEKPEGGRSRRRRKRRPDPLPPNSPAPEGEAA